MAASPSPVHFGEALGRGRDHLGERAELGEQFLGERLHVATRHGAEQHQFQHLVIGQRLRPRLHEARAQAIAMAVIVRRGFGEAVRVAVAFRGHTE
jgi:hypothetical protein